MAKRLFLLLFAGFLGIINSPVILSAAEEVPLTDLNPAKIVETVPLPEPEPEVAVKDEVAVAYNYALEDESGSDYQEEVMEVAEASPLVNYNVTYYVGSKQEYQDLALNLSYSHIYKFRNMIYGHNTWGLLGNLVYRYVGEEFTITEGGVTRMYRVADKQVYNKLDNGKLEGISMNYISNGGGHSVALLTCHGVSYGNGDASQRLVVYADEI